jgi:hypothetical protein
VNGTPGRFIPRVGLDASGKGENNLVSLPGIEPRFFRRSACNLATVPDELARFYEAITTANDGDSKRCK